MSVVVARITVLGSTGSVGESTLAVVARHPQYEIFALSAYSNVETLLRQCQQFQPRFAVVVSAEHGLWLEQQLADSATKVLIGADGLNFVASHEDVDTVMAAIVGAAGLAATLAAVEAGKKVLLANKESLVMSGELLMEKLRHSGASLLPIDSEHNAIFQCLPAAAAGAATRTLDSVNRVILTASGGPFLDLPASSLGTVTPDQACSHPRWDMGRKISVDSATLMNKGLEYIEACILFGLPTERLEVLVHPQSIVHSMVEYVDGSVLAQLATPDMRIPIAHGLAWPERIASGAAWLDLARAESLEFREPDLQRFPCLELGMAAAREGGTAPTVLNAANEVAVQAFLQERLRFDRIHLIIAAVMSKIPCESALSLDIIQDLDLRARNLANELIDKVNN